MSIQLSKKIFFGIILFIGMLLLLSIPASASVGKMRGDTYIYLDGLDDLNTKVGGVVVQFYSPIHKDLFNKTYNSRGGEPALYFVSDENGDFTDGTGNEACGGNSVDATVCKMQIYGTGYQGILLGGTPNTEASKYGTSGESAACQSTSKNISGDGGSGSFRESGYIRPLQCITQIYEQCNVSKSSSELYRIVPYLPQGWGDIYLSNFPPLNYNENDPKGGGYFYSRFRNISNSDDFGSKRDNDAVTFSVIPGKYDSNSIQYLGKNDHPYKKKGDAFFKVAEAPSGSSTISESVYTKEIGNQLNFNVDVVWIPAEETPTPTPTPTETVTPTPSESPTPTPTPSASPSPTPTDNPLCGEPCSDTVNSSDCPTGHICDPNVEGGTCTLESCQNGSGDYICLGDEPEDLYCGTPAVCGGPCSSDGNCPTGHVCDANICKLPTCINGNCDDETGYCGEIPGDLSIRKTPTQSCNTGGTQSTVTYTIVITNPRDSQATVDAIDTPDTDILDFINESSISNSGVFNGTTITWSDLVVSANSTLTLTYQAVLPQGAFATYNNTVVLYEDDDPIDEDDASVVVSCTIPSTFIFDDNSNKILYGIILVLIGIAVFYSGIINKFVANKFKFILSPSEQHSQRKKELESNLEKEDE